MLKEILNDRDYLSVLKMNNGDDVTAENWNERKAEMIELLEKYSYGRTPKKPDRVWGEVTSFVDTNRICAGKVLLQNITISFETERGVFSFPTEFYIPKSIEKPPVFLLISFESSFAKYNIIEEITDNGYAVVIAKYTDMMNDNHFGDFSGGIAEYFGTTAERGPEEWGKIGMWAYGASRVMDYMVDERDDLDVNRVAVIGHSRLGKTALWCGAQDERFAAVISNNSGYGGASSSKKGKGERVRSFLEYGSWDWYCENFKEFTDEKEDCKPYDQSFLLALIAPRLLCVGSAVLDKGADPEAEFLTTLHAAPVWEMLGEKGLVCPDRMPVPGDHFAEGNVGYHLRADGHYLSRYDWNTYIKFLNEHMK